jgi:hypothetical protein
VEAAVFVNMAGIRAAVRIVEATVFVNIVGGKTAAKIVEVAVFASTVDRRATARIVSKNQKRHLHCKQMCVLPSHLGSRKN